MEQNINGGEKVGKYYFIDRFVSDEDLYDRCHYHAHRKEDTILEDVLKLSLIVVVKLLLTQVSPNCLIRSGKLSRRESRLIPP